MLVFIHYINVLNIGLIRSLGCFLKRLDDIADGGAPLKSKDIRIHEAACGVLSVGDTILEMGLIL